MARRLMCGWESGSLEELGAYGSSSGSTQTLLSATKRNGRHAWRSRVNVSQQVAALSRRVASFPATDEVYVRLGVGNLTWESSLSLAHAHEFFALQDGTSRQVSLAVDYYSSTIQLWINGAEVAAGGALSASGWVCVEMYAKIHNSTGQVIVWVDGHEVINYTGDTQTTANASVNSAAIGLNRLETGGTSYTVAASCDFDDFALNDTTGSVNNGRIGRGGVWPLFPRADTSEQTFARSAGSANYSLVNTAPCDSDLTYVQNNNVGSRDLYNVTSLYAGRIDAVGIVFQARAVDGSGINLEPTLRSGATVAVGSAYTLTSTYVPVTEIWETDPNTSAVWSVTALNSMQVGVTVAA